FARSRSRHGLLAPANETDAVNDVNVLYRLELNPGYALRPRPAAGQRERLRLCVLDPDRCDPTVIVCIARRDDCFIIWLGSDHCIDLDCVEFAAGVPFPLWRAWNPKRHSARAKSAILN